MMRPMMDWLSTVSFDAFDATILICMGVLIGVGIGQRLRRE
jgi:hypothetical protein